MIMASYNKFENNIFRDTMVVCIGNCVSSVFAGWVVVLGDCHRFHLRSRRGKWYSPACLSCRARVARGGRPDQHLGQRSAPELEHCLGLHHVRV